MRCGTDGPRTCSEAASPAALTVPAAESYVCCAVALAEPAASPAAPEAARPEPVTPSATSAAAFLAWSYDCDASSLKEPCAPDRPNGPNEMSRSATTPKHLGCHGTKINPQGYCMHSTNPVHTTARIAASRTAIHLRFPATSPHPQTSSQPERSYLYSVAEGAGSSIRNEQEDRWTGEEGVRRG